MAGKQIVRRKRLRPRRVGRAVKSSATPAGNSEVTRRLQELRDQVDIVLPEVTARVAALEHLLLEKQLCSRADLTEARAFVREQEA